MLDILLINPNYKKIKEKRFIFHISVQKYPPLGAAYLASSLIENKISTAVLDAAAFDLNEKEVAKYVQELSPRVIGISSTSFSLPFVYKTVRKIREKCNSLVIVGGTHITHSPETVGTLDVDFGMIGDSERSLVQFMKNLGKKVEKTRGLVYKKNGKLKINPQVRINDLDLLPLPARHILPNDRYYSPLYNGKITTMVTSRGCPFDCIFCGLPNKNSYSERSPENVVKELGIIEQLGFGYVEIEDDCFSLKRSRTVNICNMILKRGIKIKWGCETRADMVDEKLLLLMKGAGCTNIRFGIESGDETIRRDIIGKNISNKRIVKTFKNMKKVGLESVGYFMLGHPKDTINDLEKTVDFAFQLEPDFVDFHLPIPIPGSRLFNIAVKEGKINGNVWDEFATGAEKMPVYVPDGLSFEEMVRMQRKSYRDFYLRLDKISEFCRGPLSIRRWGTTINLLKSLSGAI